MIIENWKKETEKKRELYRKEHNIPKIEDYGMSKVHNAKSKKIYDFISELDFANGDAFCFKCGGDGDNGEILMDLLDKYFEDEEKDVGRIKQKYQMIKNLTENKGK